MAEELLSGGQAEASQKMRKKLEKQRKNEDKHGGKTILTFLS